MTDETKEPDPCSRYWLAGALMDLMELSAQAAMLAASKRRCDSLLRDRIDRDRWELRAGILDRLCPPPHGPPPNPLAPNEMALYRWIAARKDHRATLTQIIKNANPKELRSAATRDALLSRLQSVGLVRVTGKEVTALFPYTPSLRDPQH